MKILVIKPSSLGDVIHALPFLKAVKDTFPEALIDWVISKSLMGILEDNPLIHELIIFNKDAWTNIKRIPDTMGEVSSLKRKLQSKHYDIVVDLQGLFRSGLITYFTPATNKIGFADAREGGRYFYDKKVGAPANAHAVDRCLRVAKEIGAETGKAVFPLHPSEAAKDRIKELLGDEKDYIVIVPSARWHTKRWPAENFAALMRKISVPWVIAGSTGDKKIAQSIKARALSEATEGQKACTVFDLCGKTNLKELTALIWGAKAVVSNDSGPLHIAAALNIPTVAVFGPTDPEKTGPYGWKTNKKLTVIRAGVPCSPCRRRSCREFSCMKQIKVAAVYKALKEYL